MQNVEKIFKWGEWKTVVVQFSRCKTYLGGENEKQLIYKWMTLNWLIAMEKRTIYFKRDMYLHSCCSKLKRHKENCFLKRAVGLAIWVLSVLLRLMSARIIVQSLYIALDLLKSHLPPRDIHIEFSKQFKWKLYFICLGRGVRFRQC